MTLERSLEQTFAAAALALQRSAIAHALVGALARAAWARPRASTDVDFAVACESEALAKLGAELGAVGFVLQKEIRAASAADDPPELQIWRSSHGVRLDLLIAHTPFEQEALRRRSPTTVGTVSTWTVSPEDLIVYKLIAGRPRDLDDVREVVAVQEPVRPLDWAYIEEWAEQWEVSDRLKAVRDAREP